ncbi:MAG: DUF2680 domain-containing protein [Negativicutes bacterium]|nr:DUF2680 domain-containing protein [Negativicutes bacterium]MDR3589950.1 DUF2680 domain-containing protein [Negativicutes bacterium]
MKKSIAFATIALAIMIVAGTLAYAAVPQQAPPPGQYQPPTLTETQKQELAPLYDQMLETQKKLMQKYVDYGYITQWQADQRAAFMKDRMQNRLQQGFIGPGMMGGGSDMMGRGPGHGMMGGGGSCRGPAGQQGPAANQ